MAITRNIRPIVRIGQQVETTESFDLTSDGHRRKPLDLTNATSVEINLEHVSGAFTIIDWGSCTISEPVNGEVEYTFSESETTTLHGDYYVQFRVTYENGESELVPPDGYEWIVRIGRKQPREPTPLEVSRLYADEATIGNLQVDNATIAEVVGDPEIDSLSMATLSADQLGQDISANGFRITDLPDSQDIRDAVPQEYVDAMAGENITGASNPATADYDANNYDIINANTVGADQTDTERAKTTQVDRLKVNGRGRERWSTHGRMFDDFEDLTQWTVVNGTLSADTTDYHRGTQSAFATSGTDTRIDFEKTVDLDLTDKRFSAALWVKQPTDSSLNRIRILVTDQSGRTTQFRSDYRMPGQDAGWRFLQFYANNADPDIDLSRISTLRIFATTDGTEFNIDALKLVNAPQPAKLVLGTDNAHQEIYDWGAPHAAAKGWSLTNWITTSRVGMTDRLSWLEMDELRREYGNIFANKAQTGLTLTDNFTVAEAEEEIIKGKQDLMNPPADIDGFHEGAQHFAFTSNSHNQSLLEVAEKYHLTARHGGEVGGGAPLNPMALNAMVGDGGLSSIQDSLDFLFKFGGIGILYWHLNDITEADYQQILDYIAQAEARGDVEVINIDDLYRALPNFAFQHTSHDMSYTYDHQIDSIHGDFYVNGGHDSFSNIDEMVQFAHQENVGQIWLPNGSYPTGGVVNIPTDTKIEIVGSSRDGVEVNIGPDQFRVRSGASLSMKSLTADATDATRSIWYDGGTGRIQDCDVWNDGTGGTHNIQISSSSDNVQISNSRIGNVPNNSLHLQGTNHTVINCIIEGDVGIGGGPHSVPGDGNGNIIHGTVSTL